MKQLQFYFSYVESLIFPTTLEVNIFLSILQMRKVSRVQDEAEQGLETRGSGSAPLGGEFTGPGAWGLGPPWDATGRWLTLHVRWSQPPASLSIP